MVDDIGEFVGMVAVGDADAQKAVIDVTLCDSSVSLTFDGKTLHVPWTEVSRWFEIVALALQNQ